MWLCRTPYRVWLPYLLARSLTFGVKWTAPPFAAFGADFRVIGLFHAPSNPSTW